MSARGRGGAYRLAFLWALLFAFTWQNFVAQTHRHFDPGATFAKAALTDASERGGGRGSPFDSPANCPVCREIAHAGPALLPTAIAIAPPVEVVFWAVVAQFDRLPLSVRSHRWQSRAPPARLQA